MDTLLVPLTRVAGNQGVAGRMLQKGWKAFKKNVEMLVVDGVWNVDCWWGLVTARDARDGGGSGLLARVGMMG